MNGLLLALVLAQGYYTPQEAQELFAEGNSAYGRGDLDAAKSVYERLLEHGYGGPDVLYNLGTAQLAQGNVGEAVLYLEEARREGGSASDVDGQLALAKSRRLDQVQGESEEPIWERVAAETSRETVGWLFAASWAVAWLLWLVRRLPRMPRALLGWAAGAVMVTIALPAGGVLAMHAVAHRTQEAVVLARELPARELPEEGARVAFEVHAGLKVRLLRTAGSFARVRLPNGLEGWTPREGLGILSD